MSGRWRDPTLRRREHMRVALRCAVVLVWTALLPSLAFAQASITGTVRDTSGAVLPGVTVEAASPVLIEKVRDAVTDSNGRFQIVNLRPGEYAITFTLPGLDRKSTRLNSSHLGISYAVFCLKKQK